MEVPTQTLTTEQRRILREIVTHVTLLREANYLTDEEAYARREDSEYRLLPGRPYFHIRDALRLCGYEAEVGQHFNWIKRWMYGHD